MEERIAVLFPAFGTKYTGNENRILRSNGMEIGPYRERARFVVGSDAWAGGDDPDGLSEGEISSQYISYLYGCAFSDLLKRRGVRTYCTAGYSMGVYACLYHAGAITFEQGLLMIKKAYALLIAHCGEREYAMCVVIGLTLQDIQGLLSASRLDAEVINCNGKHSFTLCGEAAVMREFGACALRDGALQVRPLPIRACYHTKHAHRAGPEFREYLASCRIKDATLPVVSATRSRIIRSADQILDAVFENLMEPFNWAETMQFILEQGTRRFIECGPGNSLLRIANFIAGDFNFWRMEHFSQSNSDGLGARQSTRGAIAAEEVRSCLR